jgi:hypothetical protein
MYPGNGPPADYYPGYGPPADYNYPRYPQVR